MSIISDLALNSIKKDIFFRRTSHNVYFETSTYNQLVDEFDDDCGAHWQRFERDQFACANECWGAGVKLSGNQIIIYPSYNFKAKRGEIVRNAQGKQSRSSAGRMVKYLRETTSNYYNICTLTYAPEHPSSHNGNLAKADLHRFFQQLRKYYDHRDFSVFWFAEIQESETESIHFHFFFTKFISFKSLAWLWYWATCPNKRTKHLYSSESAYESAISASRRQFNTATHVKKLTSGKFGTMSYARKYAKKQAQKTLPESVKSFGRFWGIRGKRDVVAATIKIDVCTTKDENRRIFKEISAIDAILEANPRAVRGFGVFVDDGTGEKKDTRVRIYEIKDYRILFRVVKRFEAMTGQAIPFNGWISAKGQGERWKNGDKVPICTDTKQAA